MIRVGPAGYPPGSKDLADAVRKTGEKGLQALEVQFVRQVYLTEEAAKLANAVAAKKDIQLSAHAPYYISLNSQNQETVAKSRDWILRSARVAKAMGAWIIVIHCAAYSGNSSEAVTKKVMAEIAHCREVLDMEKNNVILGLETMGKKGQWGTIEEIHQVMSEVEGVQPVIDFAHMHARTNGSIKGKGDFQAIFDSYDRSPTKKMHCHFSGIEYTAAGEKNHLALDAKSPDYSFLADLLTDSDRDLSLICETTDPTADAVLMRRMLDGTVNNVN
ncbi:MAG: endonuclease IV [Methanomassiliicoccales archaeon PtaU1.Bin124]|nr:MAG: endonuclease IV [Methanomassiliicoccales archaeon PtaU1.Bin124]